MKRYDMYQDYDKLVKPEEHVRGKWVYYDDAQATIARLIAERDSQYEMNAGLIFKITKAETEIDRTVKQAVDAETLACAQIVREKRAGLVGIGVERAILARLDLRKEPTL